MRHIFILIVAFSIAGLGALTRNVPSEYTTIQAAITACSNGDVVLVATGTYTENIDFMGKAITVTSNFMINHNPQTILDTIIHGTGNGSVVTVISSEDTTSVLTGFSITGGSYNLGGGISVRNASPKLTNLCIYDNTGSFGAGIYLQNSLAILSRTTICHNNGCGLKILSGSTCNISSCIVFYNTTGVINACPSTTVTFCNAQNEIEGAGNTINEPLFINHDNNNYLLQPTSPCINQGSPFIGPDYDGTRSDMGACFFQNNEASIFVDFYADETTMMADPTATVTFTRWLIPFNCTIQSTLWVWGDGTTSTQNEGSHTYQHGGYFSVCLSATSDNNATFEWNRENYLTVYHVLNVSDLSGTLTFAYSPYYSNHTLSVYQGNVLTIEPGVELYLDAGQSFEVYGQLIATGTEDSRILFSGYNELTLDTFLLYGSNDCTFQYCTFHKFYSVSVLQYYASLTIFEHCIFENGSMRGLEILSGSAIVRYNTFRNNFLHLSIIAPTMGEINVEDNLMTGTQRVSLYVVGLNPDVSIHNNIITGGTNNFPAVYIEDSSMAELVNNDISNHSMGIYIGQSSYAKVLNNKIHNNRWGMYLDNINSDNQTMIQGNLIYNNQEDGICHVNSSALISNNTIVNNNTQHIQNSAGIWFSFNCNSDIVNNVIYGNTNDFGRGDTNSTPAVSYNFTEFPLTDLVADMGNNLNGFPGFISVSDYRLTGNSLCVDTGNPDPIYNELLPTDLQGLPRVYDGDNNGSLIIDRGCYEYNPAQVNDDDVLPIPDKIMMAIYPNPFNACTTISFTLKEPSSAVVSIYNIKGELIKKLTDHDYKSGLHNVYWDGTDKNNRPVSSGIYLCSIRTETQTKSKKLLLRK